MDAEQRLLIDPAELDRMVFWYDADRDMAGVHLVEPRPAEMDEADDNWYVRLPFDGEQVYGVEVHGFRLHVLAHPFLASAAALALDEIARCTSHTLDDEFRLTITRVTFPRTRDFLLLFLGWTAARHDSLWTPDEIEASRELERQWDTAGLAREEAARP